MYFQKTSKGNISTEDDNAQCTAGINFTEYSNMNILQHHYLIHVSHRYTRSLPLFKSHQPGHLWRYEWHRMGEVARQRIVNRVREANYWMWHVGQVCQCQRGSHALAIQHGNSNHPLGGVRCSGAAGFYICRDLPFPLVPAILEPDLYLGFGELQRRSQPSSLRAAQVTLQVEGGLQLEHLASAEHSARLLLSHHCDVTWGQEEAVSSFKSFLTAVKNVIYISSVAFTDHVAVNWSNSC